MPSSKFQPSAHRVSWALTALLVFAMAPLALAAPKKTNKKHLTVHRITPPTMVSPGKALSLTKTGRVKIKIKLVYAHTRQQGHIDQTLRRDLPKLTHITGFNAYQMMRVIRRTIPYSQAITVRISPRFLVKLEPKGYLRRGQKIALKATFLYRIGKGKKRGQMAAYATTDLRLKSGRQVAFVGPAHRRGRAILLLTATKK